MNNVQVYTTVYTNKYNIYYLGVLICILGMGYMLYPVSIIQFSRNTWSSYKTESSYLLHSRVNDLNILEYKLQHLAQTTTSEANIFYTKAKLARAYFSGMYTISLVRKLLFLHPKQRRVFQKSWTVSLSFRLHVLCYKILLFRKKYPS